MASGRLVGSDRAVSLEWEDGCFSRITETDRGRENDLWLAPTLLDLQINGYAGVDFQNDSITTTDLIRAASELSRSACGQFFVTIVTDEWQKMLGQLELLRTIRAASPLLQSAIAGWHLEGPFLSEKPGFAGAHNAAVMRDPAAKDIRELKALVGSDPTLLTVAPERTGALEAITEAAALGIIVSLGHTDASARQLKDAVAAGATAFTHLANACPQELDRHDNIVWRVLDTPGLMVSLIPDQIHISPLLFRLIHRVLPSHSIYYTTDAVAPAGASPGRYRIGRFEVEVGADQIVRQPGKSNYAGSALQPLEGVYRAAQMLGCRWDEAWKFLADHPRKLMHFPAPFAVGQAASFCVLGQTQAGAPELIQTVVNGDVASSSAFRRKI